MRKQNKKNRGFIALMSAIIISTILVLVAANLSLSGFNSRFNILESETKERSSALADSCIDIALIGFAQNSSYSGNVTATVGENTCKISAITTSGSNKVFKTQGIFSNSYTNLKITVNGISFAILSVEELPTY